VEYGASPSVFNPLSLTVTKLWIEPIMRAIIHTRTFSITNDDCWYQVLAVLGHLYTEVSSAFDSHRFRLVREC
jgi:hypothetical protein